MSLTCQTELSTFIYTLLFSSHNSPGRQATFPPKSPGLTARKRPVQHWNLKPLTLYHPSPCSVAVPSPPSLSPFTFVEALCVLVLGMTLPHLAYADDSLPQVMSGTLTVQLSEAHSTLSHFKNHKLLPRGLTPRLFPVCFVASSVRALERSDFFDHITKAPQFFVLPDIVLFVLLYTALLEEIIALFTS